MPETQSGSVAGHWGGGGGGSLTCSGQTRPVVFKLLGRAPTFPRGCLRSPWEDEGERGGQHSEQAGPLALKQNSSPCSCLTRRGSG